MSRRAPAGRCAPSGEDSALSASCAGDGCLLVPTAPSICSDHAASSSSSASNRSDGRRCHVSTRTLRVQLATGFPNQTNWSSSGHCCSRVSASAASRCGDSAFLEKLHCGGDCLRSLPCSCSCDGSSGLIPRAGSSGGLRDRDARSASLLQRSSARRSRCALREQGLVATASAARPTAAAVR